ncbi:PREDICTED: nuclear receptor subfamily 0 group B member 2-like [Crocodylus porosus]|uniref:nuclear receptor subfamily 0 group B member 2-like n=1 Tax=Crocodylus porosus TaxID=8502 RepID=UPI00093E77EC|nr:PREDICTED: nuclear receptor subfamily 0 group B member 2-like [Crocodylus porosus]
MPQCLTEVLQQHSSVCTAFGCNKGAKQETLKAMASQVPVEKSEKCQCETSHPESILYQLLNRQHQNDTRWIDHYSYPPCSLPSVGCPCVANRRVILKNPEVTCMRASEVLLKTINFIRNVPSFCDLPQEDQVLLVQQCWAPLFVLGLAQERVDFELKEISSPSLLKKILLNQSLAANEELESFPHGASLAEVQKLKHFLKKFWNLDTCAKEYAYLKGIILFNPELHGLKCCPYVQTLQQEAQRTLMEFISMMYDRNLSRFSWVLGLLTSLRTVDADSIEELFFRPILGEVILNELLLETLYLK